MRGVPNIQGKGIYMILNLVDCKVYVGQAKNFNKRNHFNQLISNRDNSRLQSDYNDKEKSIEFIYFIIDENRGLEEPKEIKQWLDKYEKVYMTLMEDLGFFLYNINIKRESRELDKLITDKEKYEVKDILEDEFRSRFGKTAEELAEADCKTRQEALEYYIKRRTNNKTDGILAMDHLFLNKKRVAKILGNKEVSLFSLDIDELFISTAGDYIGEGLDQILNYEVNSIHTYGYCLWTFAFNAVATEKIRECCRQRNKQGKDVYVLFAISFDPTFKVKEAKTFDCLTAENGKKLMPEELSSLKFEQRDDGNYYVPKEIDCTAAGKKNANAFVIKEFYLVRENLNLPELKKKYYIVRKHELQETPETDYSRSTRYYRRRDNINIKENSIYNGESQHVFFFLGKLAAPYIIRLNCNSLD